MRIYLQELRQIVMGRAYIIQSMIITLERKGKSMRDFNDMRQMQQIMEMKMRERMVEMERRGQGMRKRDSNPRVPVLYGVILLIIMLLTIVVMIMLHAW
ncbi:hypothetical protein ccbrp13_24700 [Ktedonobacteria bacterium brp13]|nr:hypothetical protein ccbrp13_24700 [Ktedonobacteria bacterium brp13]